MDSEDELNDERMWARTQNHTNAFDTPLNRNKAPSRKKKRERKSPVHVFQEEEEGFDEQHFQNMGFFAEEEPVVLPEASINKETKEAVKTLHEDLTGIPTNSQPGTLPPTNISSMADKLKQRLLIRRTLKSYQEKFQKYFSSEMKKELAHLEKKTDEELETLLEDVKFTVFSKTQPDLVKETYFQFIHFNEHFVRATGMSKYMRNNSAVNDLLEEINIKYQNKMYIEPEYRLALATLAIAQLIRSENAAQNTKTNNSNNNTVNEVDLSEMRTKLQESEVTNNEFIAKYNDL